MADEDEKTCLCLKCRIRGAIETYYHDAHGDQPGDVVMSINETLNALGMVASELFSTYELEERLELIGEFASEIAEFAEQLRREGKAPAVEEMPAPDATIN